MLRIKKNDKVQVIAGKDKGKSGRILKVLPKARRVVIEGINMVKKGRRKTQQDQQGGLIEIESPVHLSNVMLIDKKTSKTSRFGILVKKDGSKVRMSKKGNEVI